MARHRWVKGGGWRVEGAGEDPSPPTPKPFTGPESGGHRQPIHDRTMHDIQPSTRHPPPATPKRICGPWGLCRRAGETRKVGYTGRAVLPNGIGGWSDGAPQDVAAPGPDGVGDGRKAMRRMARSAEVADTPGPAGDRGPGRASAPEWRRIARPDGPAGGLDGRRPVGQGPGVPICHAHRGDRDHPDRGRGQPRRHVGGQLRRAGPGLWRDQCVLEDHREGPGRRRPRDPGAASSTASSSPPGSPTASAGWAAPRWPRC